jgi:hypothetical protein
LAARPRARPARLDRHTPDALRNLRAGPAAQLLPDYPCHSRRPARTHAGEPHRAGGGRQRQLALEAPQVLLDGANVGVRDRFDRGLCRPLEEGVRREHAPGASSSRLSVATTMSVFAARSSCHHRPPRVAHASARTRSSGSSNSGSLSCSRRPPAAERREPDAEAGQRTDLLLLRPTHGSTLVGPQHESSAVHGRSAAAGPRRRPPAPACPHARDLAPLRSRGRSPG